MAAHLERVARELARLNGVHLCQTCCHRRGEHAMDLVGEHFCEHNDGSGTDCCNCQSYVGVTRPNYAELVAALECADAALVACAREAKLEEAKWWHLQVALTAMQSEIIDPGTRDECRERIESLERAVGEKGRA